MKCMACGSLFEPPEIGVIESCIKCKSAFVVEYVNQKQNQEER